jgi:signal peptidase I
MDARESYGRLLKEYAGAVIAAVVAAILIRMFLIEAYRIPTQVMRPSLEAGDLIFVAKMPYRYRSPHYGEVVVYAPSEDSGRNYIKRVVGLSGDRVEIKGGRLKLNGALLDFVPDSSGACGEERHPAGAYKICLEPPLALDWAEQTVPADAVFVMGDLRSRDASKKVVDIVAPSQLRAKALLIWLSIDPGRAEQPAGFFPKFRFDRMFRTVH